MAKQSISLGSSANDGTGTTLRAGGDIVNDNFNEVYTALGTGSALQIAVSGASAGQALVWDSGNSRFQPTAQTGGLSNIVEDTTPQLGGDLDINGNDIISTSNAAINITPNGSGAIVLDGLTWPTADGTTNTFLRTDGSGSLSWVSALADVAADTTPQLGGNLDVNGSSIVSASNGNIAITPNGSGKVILDGLSHPTADGTANQILKTDGSGNIGFTSDLTIDSLTMTGSGNVTFTAASTLALNANTGGTIVVNDGSNNADFRVESDGNANMLFVDAGNNRVGVGMSTPASTLDVTGNVKISGANELLLGSMTTTQRNALTAANGMIIYNTTDNKFQGYENSGWANLI